MSENTAPTQLNLFQQHNLIEQETRRNWSVCVDAVRADFVSDDAKNYDVLLQINSNKFQIHMEAEVDKIEAFEVVAMKGFFELSHSGIVLLRSLVQSLHTRQEFI